MEFKAGEGMNSVGKHCNAMMFSLGIRIVVDVRCKYGIRTAKMDHHKMSGQLSVLSDWLGQPLWCESLEGRIEVLPGIMTRHSPYLCL